jgi:hypothetical protein
MLSFITLLLNIISQALGNLPASIESWGKAIETLPTNKTATEQRHYESYQKALDVATKAQERYVVHRQINEPAILEMHNTGNMPWDVAGPLVQASRRSGKLPTKISSAWIIYEAYEASVIKCALSIELTV